MMFHVCCLLGVIPRSISTLLRGQQLLRGFSQSKVANFDIEDDDVEVVEVRLGSCMFTHIIPCN